MTLNFRLKEIAILKEKEYLSRACFLMKVVV